MCSMILLAPRKLENCAKEFFGGSEPLCMIAELYTNAGPTFRILNNLVASSKQLHFNCQCLQYPKLALAQTESET